MSVNIKDYMNDDIFAVLNSFLSKMETRLHRDVYVGTVLEHDEYEADSPTAGKCRIMVYGVYDNIPTDKLPWALPDQSWIGSETGSFVVPPVGTLVRIIFDNSNIYRPIYSAKILQAGKVSPLIAKNYPNNMLTMTTDAGSSIQHDRSTGEEIKTNMVGDYVPEGVTVAATANNSSATVSTSEESTYTDDGSIVETINGNGTNGTIPESFYNNTKTINDDGTFVASDTFDIKATDGSLSYAHKLADDAEITVDINDAGELIITHTDPTNGTDTITFGADNYTVEDKYGNSVAMSQAGIKILALEGQSTGAGHNYTAAQSNCNPGIAIPDPANFGGWCAIPICPLTGAPHVGNMLGVMAPPT